MRVATLTLNPAIDQTLWIPGFQAGAVNRVERQQIHAGGKGVNVACFLADAGVDITGCGFLGADNAQLFTELFSHKKIKDEFVRIAGETRTGLKILNAEANETTDINFPGTAITTQDLAALDQVIDQLAKTCDWFAFSGSLPPGAPPELYARLLQRVHAHGKHVAVDTSGAALKAALSAKPTLIKPNIDELRELLGDPLASHTAQVKAARSLLAHNIETVVVSLGAEGALFIEKDRSVHATPLPLQIQSTVGAGDGMVAGLLYGKTLGADLEGCARWGSAFAACALRRIGAGLPAMEEVSQYFQALQIKEVVAEG